MALLGNPPSHDYDNNLSRKEAHCSQDLSSISTGGILRRPTRAISDESPRKFRTQDLSSTSDTCIATGSGPVKSASCKKYNDVQTLSGDVEESSAEITKLEKQRVGLKKTRFADEVCVLHYEQESGDKYQTTVPLADETDQQERSYKRRDEKLMDIYPRTPDFSRLTKRKLFLLALRAGKRQQKNLSALSEMCPNSFVNGSVQKLTESDDTNAAGVDFTNKDGQ